MTRADDCATAGRTAGELLPLVYDELRALASRYMARERADHTLSPTSLVHEAYLRLMQSCPAPFVSRAEFFAAAARTVRRVLVDHARRRGASKRGGDWRRVSFDLDLAGVNTRDLDLLVLDDAMTTLRSRHPRPGQVAELRFFGGLTLEEAARILSISRKTAVEDWSFARAWLSRELRRS